MSVYTVTLAGQPVELIATTLDIQKQVGQRSSCTFECRSNTGVYWDQGTAVAITDPNGVLVYSGFVDTDQADKPGFANILHHQIACMDNHYLADRRLAFASFLSETAGSIVTSLLNMYLVPEGVTGSSATIAPGPAITEAVFNYEQVSSCLDKLAQQAGYWWQIDENRVLWFQPYGAILAPWILDGSQVNQDSNLSVTYGNRQYRNRQFAVGGKDKTALLSETRHGDGTTRAFTLSYPVSEMQSITLNGVGKTFDNKSKGTGAAYYYAVGDAVVAQDASQPVLQSSDSLVISYKGEYPVIALAQNDTLINDQKALEGIGTGYVESKYTDTKVHTLDAAFQIASALLAHYGARMTQLQFMTLEAGLQPGQLLTVNLPDFALNQQMLVQSVEITDDDGGNIWYQIVCVGSPYDVTWQTFWQNLTNQAEGTTDALNLNDDSTLAILYQWTALLNWVATWSLTTYVCPICGPATKCGPTIKVC
jgi:hypothetical protein